MKEKTKAFDDNLDRTTKAKLEEIRSEMHEKIEKEIALMKQDTEKQMADLQSAYDAQHEKLAAQVLKSLL